MIPQRSNVDLPRTVAFDNLTIERSSCVRLIGITTDNNLSFEVHANDLCKKLVFSVHFDADLARFVQREKKKFD